MSRGVGLAGFAAVALYISAAAWSASDGRLVLPVFDGLAPPAPYRWVDPPPRFAAQNQPPGEGLLEHPLKREPIPGAAATTDGQASISFPAESFVPVRGEERVDIRIAPIDADDVGPPPRGVRYSGNAYEFTGTYHPSGEPARVSQPVTIVLRYPTRADRLLRWDGTAWRRIPDAQVIHQSLQTYGTSDELGTFVAAGPPPPQRERSVIRWVAIGAAALVLSVTTLLLLLRGRRTSGTGRARKATQKPRPKPKPKPKPKRKGRS